MATDFDTEGTEAASETGVLATISRAEIDMQIATAKRYPRSIDVVVKQALAMATVDQNTARSMYYVVPRSGKNIEGPSVRLAEIMATCWGNVVHAARVVSDEGGFVVAQGGCYDLEKNVKCTIEVRRRITDRHGQRYSDDMIQTTGNAATSIALRNAIFRVVPRAIFNSIYEQAKLVSLGKSKTLQQKCDEAFALLTKFGAKPDEVLRVLHRPGVADITIDDLIQLHGMATAMRDNGAKWQDYLKSAADGERMDTARQANADLRNPDPPKARTVNAEVVDSTSKDDPTIDDAMSRIA